MREFPLQATKTTVYCKLKVKGIPQPRLKRGGKSSCREEGDYCNLSGKVNIWKTIEATAIGKRNNLINNRAYSRHKRRSLAENLLAQVC